MSILPRSAFKPQRGRASKRHHPTRLGLWPRRPSHQGEGGDGLLIILTLGIHLPARISISFVTTTKLGDVVGDVSAGVTVLAPPGAILSTNTSVTLSYDGRFGELFDEHAVGAKASVKF